MNQPGQSRGSFQPEQNFVGASPSTARIGPRKSNSRHAIRRHCAVTAIAARDLAKAQAARRRWTFPRHTARTKNCWQMRTLTRFTIHRPITNRQIIEAVLPGARRGTWV